MALVVQPHGETDLLGGGREAPDALGLVAFLAATAVVQLASTPTAESDPEEV